MLERDVTEAAQSTSNPLLYKPTCRRVYMMNQEMNNDYPHACRFLCLSFSGYDLVVVKYRNIVCESHAYAQLICVCPTLTYCSWPERDRGEARSRPGTRPRLDPVEKNAANDEDMAEANNEIEYLQIPFQLISQLTCIIRPVKVWAAYRPWTLYWAAIGLRLGHARSPRHAMLTCTICQRHACEFNANPLVQGCINNGRTTVLMFTMQMVRNMDSAFARITPATDYRTKPNVSPSASLFTVEPKSNRSASCSELACTCNAVFLSRSLPPSL